jgi:hypothetical protein
LSRGVEDVPLSQELHTPVTPDGFCALMMAAGAVIARSVPALFCKSPMASISAKRALLRAMAISSPWLADRKVIVAKVSRPTAMIVSRIINESVITKANPLVRGKSGWSFMAGIGN